MTATARAPATSTATCFAASTTPPNRTRHPWEECQGISQSFAYNYEDNEESLGPPARLIHRFIDIVSRNGNLAIIGGPDASGVYPENVVRRLKALGAWLKVNGEAIYATRVLPPYQEGSVRYTRSKDGKFAYAICKQWPGKSLTLKGVRAEDECQDHHARRRRAAGLAAERAGIDHRHSGGPAGRKGPAVPTCVGDQDSHAAQGGDRPEELCRAGHPQRLGHLRPRGLYARRQRTNGKFHGLHRPGGAAGRSDDALSKRVVCAAASWWDKRLSPNSRRVRRFRPSRTSISTRWSRSSFKTGWQAPGVKTWRNVNCHGQPLKVGGDTFARGVGMHAEGEAVFRREARVQAVGLPCGHRRCRRRPGECRGEGVPRRQAVCQTPVLTGKDGLWNINASLEGATDKSRLRIVIEDNGDGIQGDNVDLVDAGFVIPARSPSPGL